MSNFAYVLMAATALFVVGGLIAGVSDTPSLQTVDSDEASEKGVLFSKDFGNIGNVSFSSRTLPDGLPWQIDVEYTSPNKSVASYNQLEMSRGAFSDEESELVNFEAQEPKALYVEFAVEEARPYGEMLFILNGHTERRLTPTVGKSYSVKLTNFSAGKNTLLLATEGPGYRFWSSTMYQLRDVRVFVKDEAVRKHTQSFRIFEYELDNFDQGTVQFKVENTKATAPLRVEINENLVWEGSPIPRASPYERTFSKAEHELRPGENTISFYSEPGAEYDITDAILTLDYYSTIYQRTVEEDFEVSQVKYQLFRGDRKGRISFNVDSIGVNRPITLELNNRTYEFTPEGGQNVLEFAKEDIRPGTNTVRITTSGSYEISDFRVQIVG